MRNEYRRDNTNDQSSATLPQPANANERTGLLFHTPQKITKFFLVFFMCVAGFVLLQKLGGLFGLFIQLSARFKKALEQVNSYVGSEQPSTMALTQTNTLEPLHTSLRGLSIQPDDAIANSDSQRHHNSLNTKLSSTIFTEATALKTAADLYCQNVTQAEQQYGPIQYWDVSQVTSMESLFTIMLPKN